MTKQGLPARLQPAWPYSTIMRRWPQPPWPSLGTGPDLMRSAGPDAQARSWSLEILGLEAGSGVGWGGEKLGRGPLERGCPKAQGRLRNRGRLQGWAEACPRGAGHPGGPHLHPPPPAGSYLALPAVDLEALKAEFQDDGPATGTVLGGRE